MVIVLEKRALDQPGLSGGKIQTAEGIGECYRHRAFQSREIALHPDAARGPRRARPGGAMLTPIETMNLLYQLKQRL